MAEDTDTDTDSDDGGESLDPDLADQIRDRWDPEKMLRMVSERAGKASALDATLRNRYERRFGVDLSHVRVFTGELAEDMTKAYYAHAVTVGNTGMIMMGGTKSMATAEGQALLAHELTHVAQATRGVHRDARVGDGMELATEENEAEAEQVEAEVLAEHQGGAQAKNEGDNEKVNELVVKRVMDMLAERGRAMLMRGGPYPRRP